MYPLLLCIVLTVLDQYTKYIVRMNFGLGESRAVVEGWFHLTYVRNTGAAWGMLGGFNGWLALLSIVMLIVLVLFRRSFLSDTWIHRTALGCMLGGIIGNLVDRIRLAYVVDFFDFFWKHHHFPAFNIADAAICVGVALYLISSFFTGKDPAAQKSQSGD